MEPTEIALHLGDDTICAISTPPGVGGIAVCRVSGPRSVEIVDSLWRGRRLRDVASHTAHLGEVADSEGRPLDQAVATVFRAPRSFTGDDVVEISVHGSKYVQAELLRALVKAGARIAQPGEFTRRAYASGRLDLAEAEAVADVIASQSRAAHRIALNQMKGGFSVRLKQLRERLLELVSLMELELDFSEEEVEFASRERLLEIAGDIKTEVDRLLRSFAAGQAIKEGIPVAIVGETNAGKSSLLNMLLGDDRAIVSPVKGTTRDTIEETFAAGDYQLRLIDTAGIRDTADEIERIGVDRSLQALAKARVTLLVIDASAPINADLVARVEAADAAVVAVVNKTDLVDQARVEEIASELPAAFATVAVSALKGEGADALLDAVATAIGDNDADDLLVTNARHAEALAAASQSAARVIDGLRSDLPGDLVSQDIRETIHHLASITGDIPSTEVLASIFSRFCVGK